MAKYMSSLEVNWVRNVDKSMSVPVVVFLEDPGNWAGFFMRPRHCETLLGNGLYYSLDKGLIVVNTRDIREDRDLGAVLAHEWRHLWQFWRGWVYDGIGWSNDHNDHDNYESDIVEYFTESISEADALKFEVLCSPATFHDYWLSLITGAAEWY